MELENMPDFRESYFIKTIHNVLLTDRLLTDT